MSKDDGPDRIDAQLVAAVCRQLRVDLADAEQLAEAARPLWGVLEELGFADAFGGVECLRVLPEALVFVREIAESVSADPAGRDGRLVSAICRQLPVEPADAEQLAEAARLLWGVLERLGFTAAFGGVECQRGASGRARVRLRDRQPVRGLRRTVSVGRIRGPIRR